MKTNKLKSIGAIAAVTLFLATQAVQANTIDITVKNKFEKCQITVSIPGSVQPISHGQQLKFSISSDQVAGYNSFPISGYTDNCDKHKGTMCDYIIEKDASGEVKLTGMYGYSSNLDKDPPIKCKITSSNVIELYKVQQHSYKP